MNAKNKTCESMYGPMDGSVYPSFIKSYDKDLAISIIVNTDGAPVSDSNSYSMWPVLGNVIELDYWCQIKFSNVIFRGN